MRLPIFLKGQTTYNKVWRNFSQDLGRRTTTDDFTEVDYVTYYFKKLEEEIKKYNGKWIKGQHYVEFDRDEDATWFLVRWS